MREKETGFGTEFFFSIFQALISSFIYVVPGSSNHNSSSLSNSSALNDSTSSKSAAKENASSASTAVHDLEGNVMAIEERWCVLCGWIDQRWKKLDDILADWKQFEADKVTLMEWFDKAEQNLKLMERSPTEETNQLLQQVKDIMVRRPRIKPKSLWYLLRDL